MNEQTNRNRNGWKSNSFEFINNQNVVVLLFINFLRKPFFHFFFFFVIVIACIDFLCDFGFWFVFYLEFVLQLNSINISSSSVVQHFLSHELLLFRLNLNFLFWCFVVVVFIIIVFVCAFHCIIGLKNCFVFACIYTITQ